MYFGIVLPLPSFLPPSLPPSLPPFLPFHPSLPTRIYFGEHNVKAMLSILEPLHLRMEHGPETLKETSFNHVSTFHCNIQGGKISKTNHLITKLQLLGEALIVTCDSSSFKALSSSGREVWSSPYTCACKVIK